MTMKPTPPNTEAKSKGIWQPVAIQKASVDSNIADSRVEDVQPVCNDLFKTRILSQGECSIQTPILDHACPAIPSHVSEIDPGDPETHPPEVNPVEIVNTTNVEHSTTGSEPVPILSEILHQEKAPAIPSTALPCLPLELPSSQNLAIAPDSVIGDVLPEAIVARRMEIANLAEAQNVMVMHQERPGVITRSMFRTGSTGSIPDINKLL